MWLNNIFVTLQIPSFEKMYLLLYKVGVRSFHGRGVLYHDDRSKWKIHNTEHLTTFNPLTAKLFNLNFHPLEIVSRWRDPQLQVSENYSDLT